MIDEDRTYENEVRYNNDRLDIKNNRKDYKSNIPLVLESTDISKMEKKEELNGIYTPLSTMFFS